MELIEYPLFVPVDQINWLNYENQANKLLGLPNSEKETYSSKFIDANGQIYFIVNEEISQLFMNENGELSEQITFMKHEEIKWPTLFNHEN